MVGNTCHSLILHSYIIAYSSLAWISDYTFEIFFSYSSVAIASTFMWRFSKSFPWFARLCNTLPRVHGPDLLIYFPRDCLTKTTYAKTLEAELKQVPQDLWKLCEKSQQIPWEYTVGSLYWAWKRTPITFYISCRFACLIYFRGNISSIP